MQLPESPVLPHCHTRTRTHTHTSARAQPILVLVEIICAQFLLTTCSYDVMNATLDEIDAVADACRQNSDSSSISLSACLFRAARTGASRNSWALEWWRSHERWWLVKLRVPYRIPESIQLCVVR
jgi:hypothetical protein